MDEWILNKAFFHLNAYRVYNKNKLIRFLGLYEF